MQVPEKSQLSSLAGNIRHVSKISTTSFIAPFVRKN